MSKCKYCKKEITYGSIRCMDCDRIWQEGYKNGRESVKQTLRDIFLHLNNLISKEVEE